MSYRGKLKYIKKKRELVGWKEVAVWKDFKPSYILEAVWVEYIHRVMSIISCDDHTLVRRTEISMFIVMLPRTLATLFCSFLGCEPFIYL